MPGPGPAHQPIRTSTGTPQAKQLARQGHTSTHQQAGCLKNPWAYSYSRTWLCPTKGPGPGPEHQCACTSPRTHWALALPTSRPTPTSGHPTLHSQPSQKLALPTSRPTPALGPPGPCNQRPQHPLDLYSQLPCDLALPTSGWQPPHKAGSGNQPDWGPAMPTRLSTVVSQPQQKDPHSPCRRYPYNIQLWWPEGSALLGLVGRLLEKANFFKVGKCNQITKYIEIKKEIRKNEGTEEHVPNEETR